MEDGVALHFIFPILCIVCFSLLPRSDLWKIITTFRASGCSLQHFMLQGVHYFIDSRTSCQEILGVQRPEREA